MQLRTVLLALAATASLVVPQGLAQTAGEVAARLPGQNKPDVADRDERLRDGQARLAAHDLYVARCADCHGRDGVGKASITVDFTSPEAVAELTPDRMAAAVTAGHTPPVGEGLSTAEVASIVDYVQDALMLAAPSADPGAGRSIYARTCSVCHGDKGNAASWARNALDPPPFDFTSDKARTALTRNRMINSVTYGVLGTAMMPFTTQLNRDEIAATVDYIRQTFVFPDGGEAPQVAAATGAGHDAHAQHGGNSGVEDMTAPFPAGISGDFEAGKTFFNANCAECHGLKGDGQGRRAYFMIKKPENFLSPAAQAEFNRPHLFMAISKGVTGSTMPAWSKVLSPQEIANVGEYVFAAFIRPDMAPPPRGPGWKPAGTVEPVKKN